MPLEANASLHPLFPTEKGVEGSSTDDKLIQSLKARSSPYSPIDFRLGNLGPFTKFLQPLNIILQPFDGIFSTSIDNPANFKFL